MAISAVVACSSGGDARQSAAQASTLPTLADDRESRAADVQPMRGDGASIPAEPEVLPDTRAYGRETAQRAAPASGGKSNWDGAADEWLEMRGALLAREAVPEREPAPLDAGVGQADVEQADLKRVDTPVGSPLGGVAAQAPGWWLIGCVTLLGPGLIVPLLARRRRRGVRHKPTINATDSVAASIIAAATEGDADSPVPARQEFLGGQQGIREADALRIDWALAGEELLNWHDWRWPVPATMEHDLSRVWRMRIATPAPAALDSADGASRRPQRETPDVACGLELSDARLGARAGLDGLEQILAAGEHLFEVTTDPDTALPTLQCRRVESPPAALLVMLDAVLDRAVHAGGRDHQTDWWCAELLRLQVRHGARDRIDDACARALQLASAWQDAGDAAWRDGWQAQRLRLRLERARRDAGAARLLALRTLRMTDQPDVDMAGVATLNAWLEVLWQWAAWTQGDAARALYADAVALCEALARRTGQQDVARRQLGQTLLRRATVEQGVQRLASLEQAQHLHDTVFGDTGLAEDALATARTALERLRLAACTAPDVVCAHALSHAFLAGAAPRLARASLECRLQVQLAYEALPGMSIQGEVALGLVQSLAAEHDLSPACIEHMVFVLARHGDYQRASELCAQAVSGGRCPPALRSAWESASRRWGRSVSAAMRHAWQANARQLHLTSR